MNIHLPENVIRTIEERIFGNSVEPAIEGDHEIIILKSGEEIPLTSKLRELSEDEKVLLKDKLARQMYSSVAYQEAYSTYHEFVDLFTFEEIIDGWTEMFL